MLLRLVRHCALLIAVLATAACGAAMPDPDGAAAPDPDDWDAVLAQADGATLDLHMWGGSTTSSDRTNGRSTSTAAWPRARRPSWPTA